MPHPKYDIVTSTVSPAMAFTFRSLLWEGIIVHDGRVTLARVEDHDKGVAPFVCLSDSGWSYPAGDTHQEVLRAAIRRDPWPDWEYAPLPGEVVVNMEHRRDNPLLSDTRGLPILARVTTETTVLEFSIDGRLVRRDPIRVATRKNVVHAMIESLRTLAEDDTESGRAAIDVIESSMSDGLLTVAMEGGSLYFDTFGGIPAAKPRQRPAPERMDTPGEALYVVQSIGAAVRPLAPSLLTRSETLAVIGDQDEPSLNYLKVGDLNFLGTQDGYLVHRVDPTNADKLAPRGAQWR